MTDKGYRIRLNRIELFIERGSARSIELTKNVSCIVMDRIGTRGRMGN